MKDATKISIADRIIPMCDDCRAYAAKIVIWNAELDVLEELVKEAQGHMPPSEKFFGDIKKLKDGMYPLSHDDMRQLKTHLELMLEGPCLTEDCQKQCGRKDMFS